MTEVEAPVAMIDVNNTPITEALALIGFVVFILLLP